MPTRPLLQFTSAQEGASSAGYMITARQKTAIAQPLTPTTHLMKMPLFPPKEKWHIKRQAASCSFLQAGFRINSRLCMKPSFVSHFFLYQSQLNSTCGEQLTSFSAAEALCSTFLPSSVWRSSINLSPGVWILSFASSNLLLTSSSTFFISVIVLLNSRISAWFFFFIVFALLVLFIQ